MSAKKKAPIDWAQRLADEFTHYIETEQTLPWLRPWTIAGVFPTNLQTKHEYQGVNRMMLGVLGALRGYETPYYLTMNGMRKLGGSFTDWEGDAKEAGLPIIFHKRIMVEDKANPGEQKPIYFLRGWTVWNVHHMQGIEVPDPAATPTPSIEYAVEQMEQHYPNPPVIIHTASERAFYQPSSDKIVLPNISQFTSASGYAETKAHELTHSTGHPSRLKRFNLNDDPHAAYAKEELVAEIGAANILQRLSIPYEPARMADYVRGWGTKIKDDPKMLVTAASRADKAACLVLGIKEAETVEEVAA